MTLPDTQERYPNDELVWQWGNEFANQWLRGQQSTLTREQYVARQACDWQAHQCREQVARWMMDHGYATGHGDTIEDLLGQIVWQVRERDALNTPLPLRNQEQPND